MTFSQRFSTQRLSICQDIVASPQSTKISNDTSQLYPFSGRDAFLTRIRCQDNKIVNCDINI